MTDPLEIARTAVLDIGTVCSAHKQRKILAHAYLSALETISAGVDAIKEGIKTEFSQDYKDEIQRLAVLPKNWGSYGAPPPSMPALLAAERLLQSKADIVPRPNGGVKIEWPGACAEVSFEPDGTQVFWEKDQATQTPPSTADSRP